MCEAAAALQHFAGGRVAGGGGMQACGGGSGSESLLLRQVRAAQDLALLGLLPPAPAYPRPAAGQPALAWPGQTGLALQQQQQQQLALAGLNAPLWGHGHTRAGGPGPPGAPHLSGFMGSAMPWPSRLWM